MITYLWGGVSITHFEQAVLRQMEHVRNGDNNLEVSPHNRQHRGAGP